MVLYGLFLIVVVAIAASVYLLRNPKACGSLIYYEDISMMPFEAFRSQAVAITPEVIERQLLHLQNRLN